MREPSGETATVSISGSWKKARPAGGASETGWVSGSGAGLDRPSSSTMRRCRDQCRSRPEDFASEPSRRLSGERRTLRGGRADRLELEIHVVRALPAPVASFGQAQRDERLEGRSSSGRTESICGGWLVSTAESVRGASAFERPPRPSPSRRGSRRTRRCRCARRCPCLPPAPATCSRRCPRTTRPRSARPPRSPAIGRPRTDRERQSLRQAEVEHLDAPARVEHHVARASDPDGRCRARCAAARASAICARICSASSSGSGPPASSLASVSPSR